MSLAGYVHTNSGSYNFIAEDYDPSITGNLAKLIDQFRPLVPNEIPTEPGFCVNRGIILDPLTADQGERVTLFARLPGHPDISIDFDTTAGTAPGPNLLARNAKVMAHESPDVRARVKTLREGERIINAIPGVELVQKVSEENFTTGYDFGWESIGKQDDVLLPELILDLDSGHGPRAGSGPVQSSLSETAMVALWDAISSSVRLRPTTPPKVSVAPAPIPRGTYAFANTACPQEGWWRCADASAIIDISGGKTQYFRTRDLIPQATLLVPTTLWQRITRQEPSFQSRLPSAWELVDYRRHPRAAPALPLAQAITAKNGVTLPNDGNAASTEEAQTPVGQIAETGTPCPASGWWSCPEPEAVDGTRWFAQGKLLPPATFHAPRSWADRIKGTPSLIRYRSIWKFVRQDVGPAWAPTSAANEIDSAG